MTNKTRPSSYPLRLPDELRGKLEISAKENGRPLSSEILMRLNDSFELPKLYEEIKTDKSSFDERLEINTSKLKALNERVDEIAKLMSKIKGER